ncbi:hypothetical protein Avbf_11771 [Armadillidium vulgare]|nr:hypothetical protein Avbf_11771 [Armadillidium vulgare]
MTKCIYCGNTFFFIEDGAHTCVECGSQQINFVELIEDEEAWDLNRSRFFINPNRSKKNHAKQIVDIPLSWSYYEAYNKILKQWTDILMQLGASKKYQETVFKLWVLYLQKRNIAFKQDLSEEKSRGGDGIFDRRDVATIKGAVIETRKKIEPKVKKETGSLDAVKDKIERKKIKSRNPKSDFSYVIAGQMNETLKCIKDFEEEEMEIDENIDDEDIDESHYESKTFMGEESMLSDVTDEEEEENEEIACENDKSQKSEKMVINMARKRRMMFSNNYNFKIDFLILSPLYLNLPKLLSFLYLGSLMTEDEILLMDILRWCREDFIPYQSAAYLLQKDMFKDIDDENVFNRHLPHAAEVRYHSGALAIYLSLQCLPLHSLELVINKIVDTLKLPVENLLISRYTL